MHVHIGLVTSATQTKWGRRDADLVLAAHLSDICLVGICIGLDIHGLYSAAGPCTEQQYGGREQETNTVARLGIAKWVIQVQSGARSCRDTAQAAVTTILTLRCSAC